MTVETVFALLLFAVSIMIIVKTRRTKSPFLKAQANRCLSKRCEVKNTDTIAFEGRLYTQGTALLRNKKTGELKFINQSKIIDI